MTTWNYNPYRGWLDSKQYADGQGPSYSYTSAGRLQSRTWARTAGVQSLVTSYGYDYAGAVNSISYSDSTPGVTYTYDRLGRQATVVQNGMTATLAYNIAGEVLSESYSGGTLDGLSVTNGYDPYLRRAALAVRNSSTPMLQHAFGYDAASRLQTVTDNTGSTAYSATYSYLANSPLVRQIAFKQGTTTRMTTTKQYDYLNRLLSVSSAPSAVNFSYWYNKANQRIRSTLADGSYWLYEYDALGQVRFGHKYWSDQTPVAGQQFEYAHDDIGNRTSTKAGGDHGANLRSASYGANSLNQYTNRSVPGAVDIMGLGFATNAVTVNGQTAYRKGEYFRKELAVNNSSAALWTNITVAASGQASVSGNEFVAKTPEQFTYDADGNLTSDGRWVYGWDAENRVTSFTSLTTAPTASKRKVDCTYDYAYRRTQKIVYTNDGTGYVAQYTNCFVYDGWNLIARLDGNNNLLQSYAWGSDLSGTMQGAGGVGGLLAITDYQPGTAGTYFPVYDGNGNVAALVSATDGSITAQYEYGPFGELLRATGPMAKVNPFRFSTEYYDDESDIVMYPYRPYSPSSGGWLSRDPAEEAEGGPNLYCFVGNNPINNFDPLGDRVHKWKDSWHCKLELELVIGIFSSARDARHINLSSVASRIQRSFESHWGTWNTNGWTITFHARVFPMGIQSMHGSEWLAYNDNLVQINNRPGSWRSWVIIDRNYGRWTQNAEDWVYAHESGHLMGLPDNYTDVNGQSVATPGHEGHMMASYNGSVVWHEVLDVTGPLAPCHCR